MDVCLVLSHRCNLACSYCYAGEHHKTDMDEATLDRAVDLLYSDGADTAELSFFGGEPFLAFEAMQRAVARAETAAASRGRRLTLQCTTNGAALRTEHIAFIRGSRMRTTVSIDGIQEAHDLQRPTAGGGSSWPRVVAGLRALRAAGCRPDAMMVISPQTAPYVYRSVSWLWADGIETVRANLVLDAPWQPSERAELREQTFAVASELTARRGRGEPVSFEPFIPAMRRVVAPRPRGRRAAPPASVVVAPSGRLYPCAPMVGEDRPDGREASVRIGHLDDGPAAIAARITCDGAGCDDGSGCACAAYLETGDRRTAGPNGLWWAALCDELGSQAGRALAAGPRPLAPAVKPPSRRPFVVGLAAALGGLSIGVPALLGLARSEPSSSCPMPPESGALRYAQPPPGEPSPPPPGQLLAPPPPDLELELDGVDGRLLAPPPPEPLPVKGNLRLDKTRGTLRPPPRDVAPSRDDDPLAD
jgi:uncharacterized protein